MTPFYHSIVGLPRSGKTTFLAALWHLIDASEAECGLVLDKLVGDHAHLNKLADAWRRLEEMPRTSMAAEANVSIHLHETATRTKFVIEFPDLSGESFETQFSARSCSPAYCDGFAQPGGMLLFINADRGIDGRTILDVNQSMGAMPEATDEAAEGVAPALVQWRHSFTPEQVRIVDLLQFLIASPFERRRRRLAIGISAWDVVAHGKATPDQWLEREMPFLWQFVAANSEYFDVRVYGISAQGGDVTGVNKAELAKKVASHRIACVGHGSAAHDITAPIIWLNGAE